MGVSDSSLTEVEYRLRNVRYVALFSLMLDGLWLFFRPLRSTALSVSKLCALSQRG